MKKYIRNENAKLKKSLPKAQSGLISKGLKAFKTLNPTSIGKLNKVRDMKAVNKVLNTPVLLRNLPSEERLIEIIDRDPNMHDWYPTPEEAKAMKALFHLRDIKSESERLKNAYAINKIPYYPGPQYPIRETKILPNLNKDMKGGHGGGYYNPNSRFGSIFDIQDSWVDVLGGYRKFENQTAAERLQSAKDILQDASKLGIDVNNVDWKNLNKWLKGGAVKSLSKFKKGGATLKKMKTGGIVNANSKVSVLKSAGSKGVKSGENTKVSASQKAKGKVGGISKSPKTATPKAMYGMSMKPGMMKKGGKVTTKKMGMGGMSSRMMKMGGTKKK